MNIEVIFALQGRCWRRTVAVAVGTPADEVRRRSGLDRICVRETGAPPAAMGVFGRKGTGGYAMAPSERRELYRPLTVDPRARRRAKARGRR